MEKNSLNGDIPPEIGNLSQLEELYILYKNIDLLLSSNL